MGASFPSSSFYGQESSPYHNFLDLLPPLIPKDIMLDKVQGQRNGHND